MHLKRFRQPTVREALARVRAELGPDALILSTRLVAKRGPAGWLGRREVEVTAALDRPSVSENRPTSEDRAPGPVEPDHEIVARLRAVGVDERLAREVYEAVPKSRRRGASVPTLRHALEQCLRATAAGEAGLSAVEVFVGPPGAGKTTTIAKLAAQERARHGRRLGLVAADGYRVGAVEQLRLYADIIGSSFRIVRAPSEIEQIFSNPASQPVLVDTAGRSPRDRAAMELFDILSGHAGVRTHLVIPASTTAVTLDRMLESFRSAQPDRVVLTRLDEVDSAAHLITALRERQLPVSYLGTGQRVPEDLEQATPAVLAACVLGEDVARVGAQA